MKKPLYGMLLGGVLGILDGLSALVSAPEVAPGIAGIVIGSTFKGVVAGLIIGWFARRKDSLAAGLVFGLGVGLFLAFLITLMNKSNGLPPYYWEIMLPGGLVGLIVGYATQKHIERPVSAAR
jgi:hypothetical protein